MVFIGSGLIRGVGNNVSNIFFNSLSRKVNNEYPMWTTSTYDILLQIKKKMSCYVKAAFNWWSVLNCIFIVFSMFLYTYFNGWMVLFVPTAVGLIWQDISFLTKEVYMSVNQYIKDIWDGETLVHCGHLLICTSVILRSNGH